MDAPRRRGERARGPDIRVSGGPHRWVSLRAVFPGDLLSLWEAAKTRAEREGIRFRPDVSEAVHHGQLIEVLLASYMAGPEYPSEHDDEDEA